MNAEISQALVDYLGFGSASWPRADKDAIALKLARRSTQTLAQIDTILGETEKFAPDWNAHDLAAATSLLEAYMRQRHPELSDNAIKAIAWAWSYWNK